MFTDSTAGVTLLLFAATALAQPPAPDAARGQALYDQHCRVCHGAGGDGDGATARFLNPTPRDFTRGVYKLRSTPTGALPTDADLFGTITRGMPGTAMLPWAGLSASDRWQLVHHLKSLTERFKTEPAADPVVVPPRPPKTPGAIARGASVYVKLRCAKCHGPEGWGDGEAAWQMEDDRGRPIHAFDMRRGDKMKAGRTLNAIARVYLTGLDGTPMPSYLDAVSPAEIWSLAFYIESLFLD